MIRDEVLGFACQLGQLADMTITASKLAENPPAHGMADELEKGRRVGGFAIPHRTRLDQRGSMHQTEVMGVGILEQLAQAREEAAAANTRVAQLTSAATEILANEVGLSPRDTA
jgi:hypothetical protein